MQTEESLLHKNKKLHLILKHMNQAHAFIFISRQTHFNIISQVIFSDYNIRHDCNLQMKSAIWRINSRIHALDET